MGTGPFGISCLEHLCSRKDLVIEAVITKPPRPSARGRILRDTPIKEAAMKKGLKILEPEDIKSKDFIKVLGELKPDMSIVMDFGKILPGVIFDIPEYGSINIHASLLPLYRGASPINWAIINGERETGVTSFFIEEGMDTGHIINQRSCPIYPEDDSGILEDRLKDLAVDVLKETLEKIKKGEVRARPQDNTKATFAPKITSGTGKINWSLEGERICNLIRGLSPRPGAYSFFKKGRFINEVEEGAILVKIWKTGAQGASPGSNQRSRPGYVESADANGIKVFSGKGIVNIQELQPAGKKRMRGQAFLSGYGEKMAKKCLDCI